MNSALLMLVASCFHMLTTYNLKYFFSWKGGIWGRNLLVFRPEMMAPLQLPLIIHSEEPQPEASGLSRELVLTMSVKDTFFYEPSVKDVFTLYTSYTRTEPGDILSLSQGGTNSPAALCLQ